MARLEYIITEEDVKRQLRRGELVRRRFSLSSRMRTRVKKEGVILLNGVPMGPAELPRAGDVLSIRMPEEISDFPPEPIPIDVLYEDEDLLIVNKPAGYVVHPTTGAPDHTIANGVMRYMLDTGQAFKIRFVNRLDMDTSGVLVLGKNAIVQEAYRKLGNAVTKEYLALIRGALPAASGVIDAPIGRPHRESILRAVTPEGRECRTRYEVLWSRPLAGKLLTGYPDEETRGQNKKRTPRYSLVRLRLETGRTHQIRVHMTHMGTPVAGDHLYGPAVAPDGTVCSPREVRSPEEHFHLTEGPGTDITRWEREQLIGRQALHAVALSLLHPLTGEAILVEAPLPPDLCRALSFFPG